MTIEAPTNPAAAGRQILSEAEQVLGFALPVYGYYDTQAVRAFASAATKLDYSPSAAINHLNRVPESSPSHFFARILTIAEIGDFQQARKLLVPKQRLTYGPHLSAYGSNGSDRFWHEYSKLLRANRVDPTKELHAFNLFKDSGFPHRVSDDHAAFHLGQFGEFPEGYLDSLHSKNFFGSRMIIEKNTLGGKFETAWEIFTQQFTGKQFSVSRGLHGLFSYDYLQPIVEGLIMTGKNTTALSVSDKAIEILTQFADKGFQPDTNHIQYISLLKALGGRAIALYSKDAAEAVFKDASDPEGVLKGWQTDKRGISNHYSELASIKYRSGLDPADLEEVVFKGLDTVTKRNFNPIDGFSMVEDYVPPALTLLSYGNTAAAEKIRDYLSCHKREMNGDPSQGRAPSIQFVELLSRLAENYYFKSIQDEDELED